MSSGDEPTVEGVNTKEMSEYLAQTEIVFALLFGSHARGTAHDSSDVDIALQFPDNMDAHERFRLRNRIDAHLQEYAEGFVDVSDIGSLPTPVAHAALRDGIVLVGDEQAVKSYQEQVKQEYEDTAVDREQERREFIDRLARGDT
ncbi:type VII toxin-antitoxin system MntA family adenylyltransferase antitoxin [Halogeometricum luteum]|uniref:Nucleotidyltransferase domain-containing protein n=1 Tax=Halogeometricum luteum TaxID=2950537 RepID=A0ABU2G6W3_9EURY|nr:nucleotidyltransferase domain-containing protein [Halogeometricum sp. S3BR5-2]MDS0296530.1 nucleotidyltransferase domain-containing protein [Halogeometricum sp. S3BR5-2]